jgi:hypothetical protein
MNINVRMEGGLGDHLLANRFVYAIKDKYPSAKIKVFSDTENNHKMLEVILSKFPNMYERGGEVIVSRKNKKYMITSQFGVENYPCAIENQSDETMQKMLDCDKFYDLHIDGLQWMKYDFDWLRYFYFFPKPAAIKTPKYEPGFILTHLYARPDSVYNLDQQYIIELLEKISENNKVVILTTEEHKNYYDSILQNPNLIVDSSSTVIDIFDIASECSSFLGIDSGIRYIPYHFGKPVFVFSKYSPQYGSVGPSHLIRWLLFQKNILPVNTNIDAIVKLLNNLKEHPAYSLFPEISNNIDQYIVERKML